MKDELKSKWKFQGCSLHLCGKESEWGGDEVLTVRALCFV